MTETLLRDPVAEYHKTSLRRPGVEHPSLNPIDNLNALILTTLSALQADQEAHLTEARARGLSANDLSLLKRAAGGVINLILVSRQLPPIELNHTEQ